MDAEMLLNCFWIMYEDKNIDFNARDNNGWHGKTAFILASIYEHTDIVQLLLKYANVKGIEIPSSSKILCAKVSLGNYTERFADIKVLVQKYHQEKESFLSRSLFSAFLFCSISVLCLWAFK